MDPTRVRILIALGIVEALAALLLLLVGWVHVLLERDRKEET